MRALNPFTGEFYREALQMSRLTREMFCLMEGRHVHPSTLYPGGVGTVPTVQLFTDYLVRLMKYVEFMKKVVPLHDDLFDFFYEALPGYEKVGQRRVLLGCWGSFQDPDVCDYKYENMNEWGNAMYVTPGVVVDGKLVTTNLVDINLGIRILLGSSYYDDWQDRRDLRQGRIRSAIRSISGIPGTRPPLPRPQKRELRRQVHLGHVAALVSIRETGDYLALDTGGGPLARFWATALAGMVDIGYIKATGHSVKIYLPKTMTKPEIEFEWKIPQWSNAHRARPRPHLLPGLCRGRRRCTSRRRAWRSCTPARRKTWRDFKVPGRGDRLRLPRGGPRRALAPRRHPRRQDRQLPSRTRRRRGTPARATSTARPAPTRTRCRTRRSSRRTGPTTSSGIDIMRAVRSFDPCLPCGVHMYLGNGKVLETHHSPMFGAAGGAMMERIQAIEALIRQVEESADPATRAGVRELVQAILEYHGAGFERMVEIAGSRSSWPASRTTIWSPSCCCSTACTRRTSRRGCSARSTRSRMCELAGISEYNVRVKLMLAGGDFARGAGAGDFRGGAGDGSGRNRRARGAGLVSSPWRRSFELKPQ